MDESGEEAMGPPAVDKVEVLAPSEAPGSSELVGAYKKGAASHSLGQTCH